MNIYENQIFVPMLLKSTKKPFNDKDYIFELKFDGIRTLIFVDKNNINIRNKRSDILNNRYPELISIKEKVNKKVIFDGEIVTFIDGKPNFEKLKERALLKNKMKINYHSKNYPVIFIAYDILYENKDLTNLPLLKRKEILSKYKNTDNFVVPEYFDTYGKDLYKVVESKNLEGIIAKKKDSTYKINKRSSDWIKIKNLLDDDFYICGYKEEKDKPMASLLLGSKKQNKMIFSGTVNIGKKNKEFLLVKKMPIDKKPTIVRDNYINIIPNLECTVSYMEKTKNNMMRQPVYKGLRY